MNYVTEFKDESQVVKAAIELGNKSLKESYERKLKLKEVNYKWLLIGLMTLSVLGLCSYAYFSESKDLEKVSYEYIAEMQFYQSPANSMRGDENKVYEKINQSSALLKEGRIEEAINIFETTDTQKLNNSDLFVLAQAYQKIGHYEKAQALIETLDVNQSLLTYEIKWIQILNLIQLKELDAAKLLMEEMVANKTYNSEKINELLTLLSRQESL